MANDRREFTISIRNSNLIFRTTSYRAERGSVLHSGIYNRELTSSLAAGAVVLAGAVAALYGLQLKITQLHYGVAAALFIGLFLLFRIFVFYEHYLVATFNKSRGEVSVFIKKFISEKITIPLQDLSGIRKGYTAIVPENINGVKVVEKIALQHGTVIPGFGKLREYHTVNLEFGEGETFMVFSSEDPEQAKEVLQIMKDFLGRDLAQKD